MSSSDNAKIPSETMMNEEQPVQTGTAPSSTEAPAPVTKPTRKKKQSAPNPAETTVSAEGKEGITEETTIAVPKTTEEEKKAEAPPAASKKKRKATAEEEAVDQDSSGDKKKKKKKPPKHPRVRSAYQVFSAHFFSTLPPPAEGEPSRDLGQLSKVCADAWKTLEDKSEWFAKAAALKEETMAALPPPPAKKPLTPYLRFAVSEREKLKAAHPELTFVELSKACGAAWKELSEEAKMEWKTAVTPGAGEQEAETTTAA